VISLILEKLGRLPKNTGVSPAPILVTVFDEERQPVSMALAGELRRAGLNVAAYPEAARLPKQFKYADRMGMRLALVIGPEEAESGRVTIKNLKTGEQQSVSRQEVLETVRNLLENGPSS
jgi:histidyl-tRNA synthetase